MDLLKSRIRDAVVKTFAESRLRTDGANGSDALISPAWRLLTDDSSLWRGSTVLDREVFEKLRGYFSDDTVREILLAVAGVKVSRTFLTVPEVELLRDIASEYAFAVSAGPERYGELPDAGKGGFANRVEPAVGGELCRVYVAQERNLAEAAGLLETAGHNDLFGALLGIPPCCREAYTTYLEAAMGKQYDFVPFILDNTAGPAPYSAWLNCAAVYFGRSLLSFFPCSFECVAAEQSARSTFEMLQRCDPVWAQSFFDPQCANILYTEYEGVHALRQPLRDGSIHYGPSDVDSTELTRVADLLRSGDRLDVVGKRKVGIYRGSRWLATLEGEDVGMCVFL